MATILAERPPGTFLRRSSLISACGITVILAAIFLQWTPHDLRPFLRYDSGIFLYVGEQLRQGKTLYVDVWDHKPPLIFFLNELGLRFTGGSPAGVLILEYFLSLAFFLVAFRETKQLFGERAGLLALLTGMLLFFDATPHPNLGEVVSLPLQALSFVLLARDFDRGLSLVRAGTQGLIAAALFWTRPNGIAISIIYCISAVWIMVRQRSIAQLSRWLAALGAGFAAGSVLLAGPAVYASSWDELWFATFRFNQMYAGLTSWGERGHALVWMILFAAQHGVILVVLAGLACIAFDWMRGRPRSEPVELVIVAWLILEALFAAYTGKLYGKNIIPWIFPGILAVAALLRAFGVDDNADERKTLAMNACTLVLILFLLFNAWTALHQNIKDSGESDKVLLTEIESLSSPRDRVIFWGAFPMDTIFLAHRSSASRFFSSVPLMHGAEAYRLLAPMEITEILRNKPMLIIERDDNLFPTLCTTPGPRASHRDWDTAALTKAKGEVQSQYDAVWKDPRTETVIYKRR